MNAAFIGSGGIGDVLQTLIAATLFRNRYAGYGMGSLDRGGVQIYINSHKEIYDFVKKCTDFEVFQCPERGVAFPDTENSLNLPQDFLDNLFKKYDKVYAVTPDFLFQAPFSFPWFHYCKSYKRFLQIPVQLQTDYKFKHEAINPNTKNVFLNMTSVTMEKNYSFPALQKLVDFFAKSNYNVIIARISNWKGTPIPFLLQGKFYDLVDRPIDEVVNILNKCDYFCGIDSGFSHIAYHLGLPRLILQYQFNQPFHIARYQNDTTDCIPLNSTPETIFNRIMLNLRDPITEAIPAQFNIPYQTNTKQLLYKKYYD